MFVAVHVPSTGVASEHNQDSQRSAVQCPVKSAGGCLISKHGGDVDGVRAPLYTMR